MMDLLIELNLVMAFREQRESAVPSDIRQILGYYPMDDPANPRLLTQIQHAEIQIRNEIEIRRGHTRKIENMESSASDQIRLLKNARKVISELPDATKSGEWWSYFLNRAQIKLDGSDGQTIEARVDQTLKRLNTETRPEVLADYKKWMSQHEERFANPNNQLDRSSISFGGEVSFEADLPMPWVKYPPYGGIVCTFAEAESGPFFGCQCSKIPLENKLRLLNLDKYRVPGSIESDYWNWSVNEIYWYDSDVESIDLDSFTYVPGICHQCVGTLPKRYTSQASFSGTNTYFGNTKSHGPWWTYSLQEYVRAGITWQRISLGLILEDQLDIEIRELMPHALDQHKEQSYRSGFISQICETIENRVRAAFNLPAYGRGSQGELELYLLVKSMFPEQVVLRNCRPQWLEHLELDIWLPDISLAFEYQGEQHFVSIDHWGGLEALEKTKIRDQRKIELCQQHGVALIHINFDDPLNANFCRFKLSKINFTERTIPRK